jgi:cytoplasmic iron level regulating protein YaaA (DUF328/UPF0246 family)
VPVHVLLPPSEAKSVGGRGRPLVRQSPHPLLGADRERVLDALATLVRARPDQAAAALLLPPAVMADALAANAGVRAAPTLPALRRYQGVVYDGFDFAALSAREQRLAARSVWVFSGLFGVVRGDEAVPHYRVPAKAVLPGIGVAGTYWRPRLDLALPQLLRGRGPVIDLRSSDYAAMWRPRGELADRTISVRVLSPLPTGGTGVVSYPSKFAKGLLAAALVRRAADGAPVTSIEDVAAAWLTAGGPDAEIAAPDRLVLYTA